MASLLRSVTNRSARFALRVRERASKETTPAAGETVGAARRAFRGALGRCAFALLVGAGIAAPAWGDAEPAAAQAGDLNERIERLVRELGAEQFTVRENAQSELQRLGLAAFDALDTARRHEDVEIAMRARYLLRVLSSDWSVESDPSEVRGVLKGYGDQREDERRSRMERLSAFENARGVPALCRLARYETNPILAKRAALFVMQTPPPGAEPDRQALIKVIRATAETSKRPAAAWLRLYAQTLENPESSLEGWQRVASTELQAMRGSSDKTDSETVRDLLRWQSDFLRGLGKREESVQVARRIIDITESTPIELIDLVGWFLERSSWELVEEVSQRHADEFDRSSILLYRLAEALQKRAGQDRVEAAERAAERAWKKPTDQGDGEASARVEVGMDLRERGLFAWAEREFRSAIKESQPGDRDDVNARYRLSEMQYDNRELLAAAKTWQELVDALQSDAEARNRLGERKQFFQSRMHYFYAEYYGTQNDRAKQREHLQLGIAQDPTDADVLIAMYRFPDANDEWKADTLNKINSAASMFKTRVEQWNRIAEQQLEPEQRKQVQESLANMCNQYAWLIGNTEGDKDEALKCGLRAVELMPKTGSFLDTLAHCYFGKGDYANAVKYQTQAVKFDPHSQQIRRQLAVFQRALDEQRGGSSGKP